MRLSVMAMMLFSVLPNACCTALLTWVIIDDSIFSRTASTSPISAVNCGHGCNGGSKLISTLGKASSVPSAISRPFEDDMHAKDTRIVSTLADCISPAWYRDQSVILGWA